MELHPGAHWKFRPCLGGRANSHKSSEWKQKCLLLGGKREEKKGREGGTWNLPAHLCTEMCPYTTRGTGPCPHGQLPLRGGHTPAGRPLLWHSSPVAGKGLTPSSCSPDAGSGIHICVIINLGESAAAAGGRLCPPSLRSRSQRAAAKGRLQRGGSPGAAGSSCRTPREMNWGPPEEPACFPQRFPFFLLLTPTVLGHPMGPWRGQNPPRAGQDWGVIGSSQSQTQKGKRS